MVKEYKNPPFEEAVCEIHFQPGVEGWDITYPSAFYEAIKERFPEKTTESSVGFALNLTPAGISQVQTPERHILKCTNKNVIVRFADNQLIINVLKPYILWESFKDTILFCFEKYQEIVKPEGFQRLSLKYINKIDAGNKHSYSEIKKMFNVLPLLPDTIENDANSIQMIVEIPYHANRDILSIVQATLRPEPEKQSPVLYQLSFILATPEQLPLTDFAAWIEEAHTKIEKTFENGLTSDIKQTFL